MPLFYEPKSHELAKWYRELAAEARLEVAKHEGPLQESYKTIAARWEKLALDAEAEGAAEEEESGH